MHTCILLSALILSLLYKGNTADKADKNMQENFFERYTMSVTNFSNQTEWLIFLINVFYSRHVFSLVDATAHWNFKETLK